MYIGFSSLILNVILNFIFIPFMGIAGAALASTISYILAMVLWIVFYVHESKEKSADLFPQVADCKFLYNQGMAVVRQIVFRYLPAAR